MHEEKTEEGRMIDRDLRQFISKLEGEGELQRIKAEVDPDLEVGAIMRKVFEINGPACLFEKVKGSRYPMISGALFGFKKYGLAIGASPDIRSILQKVLLATQNPIPPVLITHAPCKENIDVGDKIDLGKFPAPRWHHLDGGRYIGTLGVMITKDPETGIRNMGIYRQQMVGKNRLAFLGTQQAGIHFQKYRSQKRAMPIATALPQELSRFLMARTNSASPGVLPERQSLWSSVKRWIWKFQLILKLSLKVKYLQT